MKKNWIITISNSDNAEIDFYKFYGSVDDLKEKLLFMVQNSDMVKLDGIYEEDYPKSVNEIEYDTNSKTYFIVLTDYSEEFDEVYTAKALTDIQEV